MATAMAFIERWLYLCIALWSWTKTVHAFNLEPRIPIIKQGVSGAYFGYSIAEHQVLDDRGKVEQNWLLVGAPLDQNLQPGTNRSGALWKCPISTYRSDCIQVVTDGKRNPLTGLYDERINSNDLMAPLSDEIKDGQWMGVTVRSQGPGRKVLVCAHRYIRRGVDYQWGQGLCYTLAQNLDYDETWEPCRGRPINKAHEQFGYCQAGTSGLLLDDDTALIGSPGPYTWKGTVFAVSVSDDFLRRDKTFYYSPLLNDSPVDKYSYLGMAVVGGRFFGSKTSYAAGAPRSNGTGQVVFMAKIRPGESIMRVQLILQGEQFASSYGYEIGVADINGDGRTDLLVAAPFYFGKDSGGAVYVYVNPVNGFTESTPYLKLTGKPESRFGLSISSLGDLNKDGFEDVAIGAPYEGRGAVYIFLGSKNGLRAEPSQIIKAEDLPGVAPVTFGSSLSGGRDMDNNGYPDLLVGAYADDKVFLLRARPVIGIVTSVSPESALKNIDPNSPGCNKYPNSAEVCFTYEACFMLESMEGIQSSLELKYRIEAETFPGSGRKFSRVKFDQGLTERPHIVERNIQLKGNTKAGSKQCFEETVFIKENTRDIQSSIPFRMTYTLVQKEPRSVREGAPMPDMSLYPILNAVEAAKNFIATFEKDCGDNEVCESRLTVATSLDLPKVSNSDIPVLELGEVPELLMDVWVFNEGEPAYEAQLYVQHPKALAFVGRIAEGNTFPCNPFNSTLVVCTLGNPYKAKTTSNFRLRFSPSASIGLESPLPNELLQIVTFTNTTSEEVEPQAPISLPLTILRRAEVSINGVGRPEQVFYGGEPRGESAFKYKDEIGTRVLHGYEIYNAGPWQVPYLTVVVRWPYQVEGGKPQGKWLLYMDEAPTVDGDGECLMDPGQVNYLGLLRRPGLVETPLDALTLRDSPASSFLNDTESDEENEIKTRRKRDTEMVILPEAITDKDGKTKQVVTMDCDRGTAKCFTFRCTVRNLNKKQSAVIKIKARLWNATLIEDYPRVHKVLIRSKAHIELDPDLDISQRMTDDVSNAETLAYPERLDVGEAGEAPWWIILVAIFAGLILLICLILLLWKLGFFRRKRPDPTLRGNLGKEKPLNGEYIS